MEQKSFFREHWGACIVVPIVFSVLALGILGALSYAFLSPYTQLVQIFMDESANEEPRDFMAELEELEMDKQSEPVESDENTIPLSSITYPKAGDRYGTITVSGTAVNCPLYYGNAHSSLNRGAGTFNGASGAGIPGQGYTIFIMGHNHTFFSDLKHAEVGSEVTIKTYYGTYVYKIREMKPVHYEDTSAYDLTRTEESLILYTCYPFEELGFTPYRYLVYCDYVSGPKIDPTR